MGRVSAKARIFSVLLSEETAIDPAYAGEVRSPRSFLLLTDSNRHP